MGKGSHVSSFERGVLMAWGRDGMLSIFQLFPNLHIDLRLIFLGGEADSNLFKAKYSRHLLESGHVIHWVMAKEEVMKLAHTAEPQPVDGEALLFYNAKEIQSMHYQSAQQARMVFSHEVAGV